MFAAAVLAILIDVAADRLLAEGFAVGGPIVERAASKSRFSGLPSAPTGKTPASSAALALLDVDESAAKSKAVSSKGIFDSNNRRREASISKSYR